MALTSSDNPKQPKPEPAKADSSKTSSVTADKSATDADLLESAAASGDPAVQTALAEREIALRNDDKGALKAADERLRVALGK